MWNYIFLQIRTVFLCYAILLLFQIKQQCRLFFASVIFTYLYPKIVFFIIKREKHHWLQVIENFTVYLINLRSHQSISIHLDPLTHELWDWNKLFTVAKMQKINDFNNFRGEYLDIEWMTLLKLSQYYIIVYNLFKI